MAEVTVSCGNGRRHYKTDFAVTLRLMQDGSQVSWPTDMDFTVTFKGGAYRQFVCSRIGGEYKHCKLNSDGSLTCYVDNHGLGLGEVTCEIAFSDEDANYADGERREVAEVLTGIVLARDVTNMDDYVLDITVSNATSEARAAANTANAAADAANDAVSSVMAVVDDANAALTTANEASAIASAYSSEITSINSEITTINSEITTINEEIGTMQASLVDTLGNSSTTSSSKAISQSGARGVATGLELLRPRPCRFTGGTAVDTVDYDVAFLLEGTRFEDGAFANLHIPTSGGAYVKAYTNTSTGSVTLYANINGYLPSWSRVSRYVSCKVWDADGNDVLTSRVIGYIKVELLPGYTFAATLGTSSGEIVTGATEVAMVYKDTLEEIEETVGSVSETVDTRYIFEFGTPNVSSAFTESAGLSSSDLVATRISNNRYNFTCPAFSATTGYAFWYDSNLKEITEDMVTTLVVTNNLSTDAVFIAMQTQHTTNFGGTSKYQKITVAGNSTAVIDIKAADGQPYYPNSSFLIVVCGYSDLTNITSDGLDIDVTFYRSYGAATRALTAETATTATTAVYATMATNAGVNALDWVTGSSNGYFTVTTSGLTVTATIEAYDTDTCNLGDRQQDLWRACVDVTEMFGTGAIVRFSGTNTIGSYGPAHFYITATPNFSQVVKAFNIDLTGEEAEFSFSVDLDSLKIDTSQYEALYLLLNEVKSIYADDDGRFVNDAVGTVTVNAMVTASNAVVIATELSDGLSDDIYGKIDTVDEKIDTVDEKIDTVDEKIDTVDEKIDTVDEKIDTLREEVDEYTGATHKVVCWGDSLTIGNGNASTRHLDTVLEAFENMGYALPYTSSSKITMPGALQTFLGDDYNVANCGVGGENINTILAREGANTVFARQEFTLPATTDAVDIGTSFSSSFKIGVYPSRTGSQIGAGVNPCYCDGVECTLSYSGSTGTYSLARTTAGTAKECNTLTPIIFGGQSLHADADMAVLWCYQNGGYDDVDDLLDKLDKAVEALPTRKYVILNLHTKTADESSEYETAMARHYGNKFINWRDYVSQRALDDFGITPVTDDDLTDEQVEAGVVSDVTTKEQGTLPLSFWSSYVGDSDGNTSNDKTHLTSTAYLIVGYKIYERFKQLGYV